jgi:hypothetical protein
MRILSAKMTSDLAVAVFIPSRVFYIAELAREGLASPDQAIQAADAGAAFGFKPAILIASGRTGGAPGSSFAETIIGTA